MGTRRYRELKLLTYPGDGRIIVPGAGTGGSDVVIRSSIPPPFTSGWMSDATNFPPFPQGQGDVGCQMSSFKTFYKSEGTGPYKVQGLARRYEGRLHSYYWAQSSAAAKAAFSGAGDASFSHPDSLLAAGATAIARTTPTHPVAGAAVALAELRREGLPHVPTAAAVKLAAEQRKLLQRGFRNRSVGKVRPKDLGDEYLNYEFGWKPIVSDLRKFALSIKRSHEIVDQLNRDSGRNVRRRYRFPASVQDDIVYDAIDNSRAPFFEGDLGQCDVWMQGSLPPRLKIETKVTTERWFSGCYTYHVPPADTFYGKARRFEAYANKILGTRLTPEVVWNLAPWSWAADWFSNAGDVATNISSFSSDGLALRYGYIMESNTHEYIVSLDASVNLVSAPDTRIHIVETFGSKTMQRRYASPFGFGLTYDGFTPRQQAITVALGLTQGARL